VQHSQFGKGTVVSCKPMDGDSEVTVAFPGLGIKKLLLSFAKLEKID
jgi:DNA helicase-2/ATP-dependent DNA helicase PcrA